MSASLVLFCLALAFILGVVLASLVLIPQAVVWVFLCLAILMLVIYFLRPRFLWLAVLAFCLLFFSLGILRVELYYFSASFDNVKLLNDKKEKITLVGYVLEDPVIKESSQKIKVLVDKSIILVTASRYPEYYYHDEIEMTGTLKTPPVFDDFNYRQYLAKDGIYSLMDYPVIKKMPPPTRQNIRAIAYGKILSIKRILSGTLDNYFSSPKRPLMQGIVFGDDAGFSPEEKQAITNVGLSHITAVSGSNIVIIIEIVLTMFLALGLWRQQALALSLIFIWVYLLMIGFPVSAIRAGIMGSVLLLSQIFGRQNSSSRMLVLAAAIMALQNPMVVCFDISFQLSFLASLGIIYIKPMIDYGIMLLVKKPPRWLVDGISVTLSAQVFTLPVIIENFRQVSLIAPIANILVLPVIPYLTVLGALIAILGSAIWVLGFVISLPCQFVLSYFFWVVNLCNQPWATTQINFFGWQFSIIYYGVLFILIWQFKKYQKPDFV